MDDKPVDDQKSVSTYTVAGILLFASGCLLGLDQFLKTGWLTVIIFPLIGTGIIGLGLLKKRAGWLVAGSLTLGIGCAILFLLAEWLPLDVYQRIGAACISFGISWLVMGGTIFWVFQSFQYWVLVPASLLVAPGIVFYGEIIEVLRFILFVLTMLGMAFLIWGLGQKLVGLIIPGCLLLTIGPGIYFSWGPDMFENGLAQTGMMLVWFAFGWGMITIFSRRITHHFAWWPLIPGGILAVTGWGLYIGGDPSSALGFIGNTGSIGIMIFGLYLLLMRRGLHH